MAPYKPFWVEEPIYPPEDFEALAKLRASTGVAMGIGENATSLRDFRRMVTIGSADYIQPSIVKLGITAMTKSSSRSRAGGAPPAYRTPFIWDQPFLRCCIASRQRTKNLRSSGCLPTSARLRSPRPYL
jgi:hypothetical protein